MKVWVSGGLSVKEFGAMLEIKLVPGGSVGAKLSSGVPVGEDFGGQGAKNVKDIVFWGTRGQKYQKP